MDPARPSGLRNMDTPRTADELAEFIYCVRWMSVTIPNFAKRVAPLSALLEKAYSVSGKRMKRSIKNITLHKLSWGPDHETAFNDMKYSLRIATQMSYSDPSKVLCVFTDAPKKNWSGVVPQTSANDLQKLFSEQCREPLAFLCSEFKGAQLHWTTFEKEAFAIHQTFARMDYLLLGQHLTQHTSSRIIAIYSSSSHPWPLSQRLDVMSFRSGADNVFADLLTCWSRRYRKDRQSGRVRSLVVQQNDQVIPLPTDLVWPDISTFRSAQRAAAKHKPDGFFMDSSDGLWKCQGRIWIPSGQFELQLKVMVISHSGAIGHRSQHATLSNVSEAFWWPSMRAATTALVRSCLHCLVTRSDNLISRPMGTALHGNQPNEVVHLDYLYMGPSNVDHKYLLIMRDDFSSYVRLWPSASCTSEAAVDALTTWTGSFRAMQWLVTDQGAHFNNSLARGLTEEMGVHHHFTTAYSPWANGTVERVGREVLRACCALLCEWSLAPRDWPATTECVQSVLNYAPPRRLGSRADASSGVFRTPLEVFSGHRLVRPLLRALPTPRYQGAKTDDEAQARRLIDIDAVQEAPASMHRDVNTLISASRRRHGEAHNQRTNEQAANFSTGDLVLVRSAVNGGHKLYFT